MAPSGTRRAEAGEAQTVAVRPGVGGSRKSLAPSVEPAHCRPHAHPRIEYLARRARPAGGGGAWADNPEHVARNQALLARAGSRSPSSRKSRALTWAPVPSRRVRCTSSVILDQFLRIS